MRTILFVSGIQWGSVTLCALLLRGLFGGISILPIPFGLFCGALLFFWFLDTSPLNRTRVRATSKACGAVATLVVTLGYWAAFAVDPESFSLKAIEVLWLGPVLGLGGGFLTMVCTLIAGDTAAALRSEALS